MHGYAALTCAGRICAAGYVNFCPMSIDEKPSKYSNMLATAIHEARAVHSVRAPWVYTSTLNTAGSMLAAALRGASEAKWRRWACR